MVSAGPTYEKIDPVRFIGNYSSGKMGYAIAGELAQQGAEVFLVSGPVSFALQKKGVHVIHVESAKEMHDACLKYFPDSDGAIMAAAVSDFSPVRPEQQKTKRGEKIWNLELHPTVDIAATLGKIKRKKQILAGFALETNDEIANARKKLINKNLDFIVLNSLRDQGAGFGGNTNKITIIDKSNNRQAFELKRKKEVAADIVEKLISLLL